MNVHAGGGAAACETVNVFPAAVIVPVLAPPVFAATENATVPLPVPEPPLVIVIHDAFAPAVHAHVPVEAPTAMDPVPPDSVNVWLAGEIVNVQGAGAAACDTVNVLPPIVRVPVRAAPEFAAAT